MEVVLGIVAVLAVVVAFFMGLQAMAARAAATKSAGEIDGVRSRLSALESESKKAADALEAKRKESEELKEKLKDLKKRRHDEKESARLRQDIQHAREEIEREMEKKLQVAREDAEIARAQVKKLSAEVDQLKSRRQERPVEVKAEAVKPAEPAGPVVPRQATPEEVARAEAAEKAAGQARRKVEEMQEEVRKVRSRAETDRRMFLVQKSEVEIQKDKFRGVEAKLNALVLEREDLKKAVWLLEKELKALKPTAEAPKKEEPKPEPVKVEAKVVEAKVEEKKEEAVAKA